MVFESMAVRDLRIYARGGCALVVITRPGREPVVMVALDQYESMRQTLHLARSPANAERLKEAMARLDAGQGERRDLLGATC
jgi:antitoxin YefM